MDHRKISWGNLQNTIVTMKTQHKNMCWVQLMQWLEGNLQHQLPMPEKRRVSNQITEAYILWKQKNKRKLKRKQTEGEK